ncbi:uncharacterized protein AAES06_015561 [Glossophaga mutica]
MSVLLVSGLDPQTPGTVAAGKRCDEYLFGEEFPFGIPEECVRRNSSELKLLECWAILLLGEPFEGRVRAEWSKQKENEKQDPDGSKLVNSCLNTASSLQLSSVFGVCILTEPNTIFKRGTFIAVPVSCILMPKVEEEREPGDDDSKTISTF